MLDYFQKSGNCDVYNSHLKGQVIACEQESKKSNWLEFTPLRNYKNASNEKYTEVYWHKAE
jgi:hypothetical protein